VHTLANASLPNKAHICISCWKKKSS